MSESLTVALLFWATGANPSRLLFCSEQPEWFAHGLSLKKSNRVKSDYSDLLFGKGETYEKYIPFFFIIFSSECSFLRMTRALRSWSLFCHERPERIDQGRSLIWAILSESTNSQPCTLCTVHWLSSVSCRLRSLGARWCTSSRSCWWTSPSLWRTSSQTSSCVSQNELHLIYVEPRPPTHPFIF